MVHTSLSDMLWDQPVWVFVFNKNVISVYKLCVLWGSWDHIMVQPSIAVV